MKGIKEQMSSIRKNINQIKDLHSKIITEVSQQKSKGLSAVDCVRTCAQPATHGAIALIHARLYLFAEHTERLDELLLQTSSTANKVGIDLSHPARLPTK